MFRIPDIERHVLASSNVDQAFQIDVMLPIAKVGSNERFPVLYITDANASFDLARSISQSLQVSGRVNRYILVGIGYPGSNPAVGEILRCRDMTPDYRPEITGLELPIEGVASVPNGGKRWHGAGDFTSFIRDELIPFIDATYPTRSGERGYAGHSLGGGFGLHLLLREKNLFSRFLISSPGLSYGESDYGLEAIEAGLAVAPKLDARLYLSVGGEEEFEPALSKVRFVSGWLRLCHMLRMAAPEGLDVRAKLYAGETHHSVFPMAFTHGVQFLYDAPSRSPLAL